MFDLALCVVANYRGHKIPLIVWQHYYMHSPLIIKILISLLFLYPYSTKSYSTITTNFLTGIKDVYKPITFATKIKSKIIDTSSSYCPMYHTQLSVKELFQCHAELGMQSSDSNSTIK